MVAMMILVRLFLIIVTSGAGWQAKPVIERKSVLDMAGPVVFGKDNKTLILGSTRQIRIYDVATAEIVRKVKHSSESDDLGDVGDGPLWMSRDGSSVAIFGNRAMHIVKLSSRASQSVTVPWDPAGLPSLAMSGDGKILAVGHSDSKIYLVNTENGKLLQEINPKKSPGEWLTGGPNEVAFSPNGETVVSTTAFKIIFWNSRTGKHLGTLPGHRGFIRAVCFSRDGKYLASGDDDNRVMIWNVRDKKQVVEFVLSGKVRSIAFSPDSRILACVAGSELHLLDWNSQHELNVGVIKSTINSVVFSADGKMLACSARSYAKIPRRITIVFSLEYPKEGK